MAITSTLSRPPPICIPLDRKIIVGVDFGTTYSGLAFMETRRPDLTTIIEAWPISNNIQEGNGSAKVPTQLRFTPHGIEWGHQIPLSAPAHEREKWFKLGLSKAKQPGDKLANNGQDPKHLAEVYLGFLAKHLMYILEKKLGKSILDTVPIECVITVPAIWSEADRDRTLLAAQRAGFPGLKSVTLVPEPEAAAIAAIDCIDPHNLKVGDTFVLCDAGGGTVDLISYRITALSPLLQVEEVAAGSGGLCGSTFLNTAFEEYMTSILKDEEGYDRDVIGEAVNHFDTVVKPQYMPLGPDSHTESFSIPVPGLANNPRLGIRKGKWHMSLSAVDEIIDPIIKEVISLVRGQIEATNDAVSKVILVGGFGQNRYLAHALRFACGDRVEILQPVHGWTAVVRGAVMMGLANSDPDFAPVKVISRFARKHYGTKLHTRYKVDVHDEDLKYWCARDQHWKVLIMRWFVKKDTRIKDGEIVSIPFWQHWKVVDGKPKQTSIKVKCDSKSNTAPLHSNANVKTMCKLNADLTAIPQHVWDKTIALQNDGESYYVLTGSVDATFNAASTTYVLNFEGNVYDTVTAEYA